MQWPCKSCAVLANAANEYSLVKKYFFQKLRTMEFLYDRPPAGEICLSKHGLHDMLTYCSFFVYKSC